MNYDTSNLSNKINAFQEQKSLPTSGLSLEVLMKKTVVVVTEENEFVSIDESKFLDF